MDNQDAVNQPAEQTVETESAPVENQDDNTQPIETESPVESNQPEDNVIDKSVPYNRFHEVNSEKQRLAEENAFLRSQVAPPAPVADVPQLDPDSEAGVRAVARQEWDEMNRQSFINKYGNELKTNKPLDTLVKGLIVENSGVGRIIDREGILNQAKSMLENQMKPVIKQAQTEGFKEGQDKAVLKGQTGAVGSTSYKEPAVDDSALSTEELRKKYNIPRI
jgi:hypothetical protein